MVKNHLKRLAMPKVWTTKQKKGVTWVARVNPGAHSMDEGMPLVLLFREVLDYAKTAREVREIMRTKKVLVDGTRKRDIRYNVGLMDIISIPDIKEYYRISFGKNGKLAAVKIDEKESKSKICKIKGKGQYKGKMQLKLSDGRVVLTDKKDYKAADSIILTIPEQKITNHFKFEKGAFVLLTKGKRIGSTGTIEEIRDHVVIVKSGKETFETPKKYCFVVGKGKAALIIE